VELSGVVLFTSLKERENVIPFPASQRPNGIRVKDGPTFPTFSLGRTTVVDFRVGTSHGAVNFSLHSLLELPSAVYSRRTRG
jgi:hypothetical protein